jgi:hypothetical protein
MYYQEHLPPHIHAEYRGKKAKIDFQGNILKGDICSKTAMRLIRDWIDLHYSELQEDWNLAQSGKALNRIKPLE